LPVASNPCRLALRCGVEPRLLASPCEHPTRKVGPRMRLDNPEGQAERSRRHELAIGQSLRFAEAAAAGGNFDDALAWLRVVERVEGELPHEWQRARAAWVREGLIADPTPTSVQPDGERAHPSPAGSPSDEARPRPRR
jgi:hypothetical protein